MLRLPTAALFLLAAPLPLSAADAPVQTAQAEDPDAKIKCRRIEVTGSMIKKEKVCKTVGEWRRLSDRGNEAVRDLMDTGRTCAGGACGNGG